MRAHVAAILQVKKKRSGKRRDISPEASVGRTDDMRTRDNSSVSATGLNTHARSIFLIPLRAPRASLFLSLSSRHGHWSKPRGR